MDTGPTAGVRKKDDNSKKRKRKSEVDSGVARPRQKDGESGKERSSRKMSRMGGGGGWRK